MLWIVVFMLYLSCCEIEIKKKGFVFFEILKIIKLFIYGDFIEINKCFKSNLKWWRNNEQSVLWDDNVWLAILGCVSKCFVLSKKVLLKKHFGCIICLSRVFEVYFYIHKQFCTFLFQPNIASWVVWKIFDPDKVSSEHIINAQLHHIMNISHLFLLKFAVPAVTDATWQSLVLDSGSPVLVEFWAPWCGPCRMIHPIIDELSKQYVGKLKCYKVNTDESPSIATRYGIRSIPTVMIFKNGEKKDTVIGAVPKSTLTTSIEKFL